MKEIRLEIKLKNKIMTQNSADKLIVNINNKKNPSVIGLDPFLEHIPDFLKNKYKGNSFEVARDIIIEFNKAIIDAVADIAPAVKPQIAFYEKYGSNGIIAFEETIKYARKQGLFVIGDCKRNDIGSTAEAYAQAYLGKVTIADNSQESTVNVDSLTVTPYLGSDGIEPFVKICKTHNKGIFVLVKTSNPSAGEFQDQEIKNGNKLYEQVAEYVNITGAKLIGEKGYSSVGAVVGATYPKEAKKLRNMMPKTIFLVPGYGAQGGGAEDTVPCFNDDGHGAIVNSSRGILYAYKNKKYNKQFNEKQFIQAARQAAIDMRDDITKVLKNNNKFAW